MKVDPPVVVVVPATASFSWIRVGLMVGGLIALLPLTLVFGLYGFLASLFFLLLAALAK